VSGSAHERCTNAALDVYERVLGPDHPYTAHSLNNLANTLQDLGERKRAEEVRQRARASRPAG
jgi:hypothetical protein